MRSSISNFDLSILLVALVAVSLGAPEPASAALEITTRTVAPSGPEVLVASPVPADVSDADVYLWTHGAATSVGVGQTFRVERAATLDRITVLARPQTDQTAGETAVLTLGSFTGPADVTPGEVLAVASGALPRAWVAGEATYLVLDLDDVELEAGRQYGFLLDLAGGGNVNNARIEVFHTGGDTYADGLPFLHEGAFYEPAGDDLVFFLEGMAESGCPPLPSTVPLLTSELPGFRFWVRFGDPSTGTWWGESEPLCTPEALCVSGALPGRTEVMVRIVGPKPNGYLWPTLVKLSTSRVEVWIERPSTGAVACYVLPGAEPGSSDLPGLFDRTGFLP
jgi:hypothetical protein